MDPYSKFNLWFSEEKELSNLKLPAACCLSTIGLDGFPNARFVSLKGVTNKSFVITGPSDSRKGNEMNKSSKAALTFWWSCTARQIRIQGNVSSIPDAEAESYFNQRNRDAQIVSAIFDQGKEIESITRLQDKFKTKKEALKDTEIKRPQNWSGIYIKPIRIEFMTFQQSRLHERSLYTRVDNDWVLRILQP